MATFKNIALLGGGGAIGKSILDALRAAGKYTVTVVSRPDSTTQLPSWVQATHADFDSIESVAAALKGQDVVICTFGMLAITKQLAIIDAAIAAGVKRFIPSEFGCNTLNADIKKLPTFADKIAVNEKLMKKAREGLITYTLPMTGGFLDFILERSTLFANFKDHSAEVVDGGNVLFSATTIADVAKTVAGIIEHPTETENRSTFTHSIATTQNRIIKIAEQKSGETCRVDPIDCDDIAVAAFEEQKKASPNPYNYVNFIKLAIFGREYGGLYEKTDNDLFGVQEMSLDDLKTLVEKYA